MQHIIFNPIYNKKPLGSVADNKKISFEIFIKKNFYLEKINLVLKDDYSNTLVEEKLIKSNKEKGDYFIYHLQIDALPAGIYFYYFKIFFSNSSAYITNNKLNAVLTESFDHFPMWQLSVHKAEFSTPSWFKGGIMYQIFPDRFKKSPNYTAKDIVKNESDRFVHEDWNAIPHSSITHKNYAAKDFYKGNLEGIREEIDYFKKLNVESIYLNPIVESAENHRYSTADYFKLDPWFGTNEDFLKFCTEFKEKDISIILDGVFSHTGSDSIYFNKDNNYDSVGAYNSKESRFYPWFDFNSYPNSYNSWWGFDNLPTVNKNNEDFLNFITKDDDGVVNFWQKLGIAGWRLDVADEFPDKFLDEIRRSAKSYDKESLIIGEVWEDASNKTAYNQRRRYFQGDQLDSVMNYPWREAIINFVKYHDAEEFIYQIHSLVENYPVQALDSLMNLLSSHDMPRILNALAVDNAKEYPLSERPTYRLSSEKYAEVKDLSKFAAFIQFTLPGVPSIYYGDEIGMYGFTDPYNRLGFDRNNIDEDLLAFYQKLSTFRFENKKDFVTGFNFITAENGLIHYKRNSINCVVNITDKAKIIESIKEGTVLFSNKDLIFTKYGLVVPARTYVAVK
ncbi:glycoside hydrolase family 13 protein [Gemella sp. 19428wG2_WT2a]|nr:glycoside hydrolase family 13 protein [Gemella sp. 19428wG2_WT2a]TFU59535.1 glycoside hydrolase family 13 protein [Gemella sp. WT2a]